MFGLNRRALEAERFLSFYSSLFVTVFTLLFSFTVAAQDSTSNSTKTTKNAYPAQVLDPISTKMKEVDLGFIKLSIPDSLEKKESKCIEGGCWKFSDGEMVLSIDWNLDCWRPTFEKSYGNYAEEIALVDNVRTRLWSFLENKEYRFISGANYAIEKENRIGLGVYLSSKTADSRQLAKRVFQSVKFQKIPLKSD